MARNGARRADSASLSPSCSVTARAGGIATATTFLAELLARRRARRRRCSTPRRRTRCSPRTWRDRYRRNGIAVERIDRPSSVAPAFVADSYRTYQQLKGRTDLDVIVFQDWLGLGYCSHVGQAVRASPSPTPGWSTSCTDRRSGCGRRTRPSSSTPSPSPPRTSSSDRRSWPTRWSGPARTCSTGWRLAGTWVADRRRIFYPTAGMVGLRADPAPTRRTTDPAPGPARRCAELVFFGRYEERKGIRVFAEALNRLGADRLEGVG